MSTIITKMQNSKKAVDFRDGLVCAYDNDYAMLHGAGGQKHAPVSVIGCWICDYSKGKGSQSVTVSANFDLEIIALLHAKAKQIMLGGAAQSVVPAPAVVDTGSVKLSKEAWSAAVEALQQVITASKTTKQIGGNELIELGKRLRTIHDSGKASIDAMEKQQMQAQQPAASGDANEPDFKHSQVKVNAYRKGQNGIPANHAPVTKVTITHSAKDKYGQVIRSPWYISISSGHAEIRQDNNGATTYVDSTYQKTGSAFVNVSDIDMFRMMEDCKRYIDAFTMYQGIPLIQRGLALREKERQERSAQQGDNRM